MLMVYDVEVDLRSSATTLEVLKLKDHFKALAIDAVGLDEESQMRSADELLFSLYGNVGPFMMKRMAQECIRNIFPESVVAISHRE